MTMNPAEAAVLLARISASDNREVSEAAARAWAESLPDVDLADALEYLPSFYRNASRDTKNWVYPGDVLLGVRELHTQRRSAALKEAGQLAIAGRSEDDEDVRDAGGLSMVAIKARAEAGRRYDVEHPPPGADIDEKAAAEEFARRNRFVFDAVPS